jgi:hypothetical protein
MSIATVSVVVDIGKAEQILDEKIKDAENWANERIRLNLPWAMMLNGPSAEYGGRLNNWEMPFPIGGESIWYRDGLPYPSRLFGFGTWVPPRVSTFNNIVRADLDVYNGLHWHFGDDEAHYNIAE